MTIHLRTWGDLACFTRPEMKVERVSYSVITPSAARVPNLKGDLLVLRANFVTNREDFNIQKGQYEEKVSPTIDLSLSIAGASAKP